MMTRFVDPIRPTVRAVIFREGNLLVQVKQKLGRPTYLTLPGGRQESGETMVECLARECQEEIGAQVAVGHLLHVAEVFKPRQNDMRHQIEMLFACTVSADYAPQMGYHPDPSQVDTVWASPETEAHRFRPAFAVHLSNPTSPRYLGVFDG